jgi:hypothetical protein
MCTKRRKNKKGVEVKGEETRTGVLFPQKRREKMGVGRVEEKCTPRGGKKGGMKRSSVQSTEHRDLDQQQQEQRENQREEEGSERIE